MTLKSLAQKIIDESGTVCGTEAGTDCPTLPPQKNMGGTAQTRMVEAKTGTVPLSRPGGCGTVGQQRKSGTVCGTADGTDEKITPSMLHAWRTARPWILEHLQELQAKGWTRKQLFRADVLTHPHGEWGPAWSWNWIRPGAEPSIDRDGAIRWTWLEPNGRPVSQAARPKK